MSCAYRTYDSHTYLGSLAELPCERGSGTSFPPSCFRNRIESQSEGTAEKVSVSQLCWIVSGASRILRGQGVWVPQGDEQQI